MIDIFNVYINLSLCIKSQEGLITTPETDNSEHKIVMFLEEN